MRGHCCLEMNSELFPFTALRTCPKNSVKTLFGEIKFLYFLKNVLKHALMNCSPKHHFASAFVYKEF